MVSKPLFALQGRLFVIAVLGLGCLLTPCFTGLLTASNAPDGQGAVPEKPIRQGDPVFIRIFKQERVLEVWTEEPADTRFNLVRRYRICAMSGTLGPKTRRGDHQAPEGFYRVGLSQLNPNSRFHLAFNIGYPNAYDRAHGYTGDFIMVHGDCVSVGCFAMTDEKITEIYTLVERALKSGQEQVFVHIFPFRLTDAALNARAGHPWEGFWRSLKPGFDAFEKSGTPPVVSVRNGAYIISD